MNITCGGCDKVWTGVNNCHCSHCHETTSSITYFDQHRNGKRCKTFKSLGLHLNERGIWVGTYWGKDGD